jgi:hypothetical protein
MELPVTTPFTDPRRKVVTGQLQKFFHHLVGEARSVAQRLWCRIERCPCNGLPPSRLS